jgi:hypothetical protein
MKRQLISLMIILPLLSLFFSSEIYAQGGTGELPGTKPPPTPKPPGMSGTGELPGTKPATTPKPPTRGSRPASFTPVTLNVGEERKGRLDPSDKGANGSSFEEMILLNAKSEDWLTFRIESDNPSLGLQILDKNNVEVAVAKDPSGDFKINTPTGGLPADGDYRIRVTCAIDGKNAVPFTIKVNRVGLTAIAYVERFTKIYTNYHEDDPASVEETVTKLEELGRDSPSRPTAFELLGRIYLDVRKDIVKAEAAMEQAIKANGVALIRISFDSQWRRMAKSRSGDFSFEEARSGWLKIGPGQLTLTDLSNKALASLNGQQIRELSKTLVGAYNLVTITANNARKPYVLAPKSMQEAEAELVIKLIQNHVMGKAN